jgi:Holliday junction DNA helicase RuvA
MISRIRGKLLSVAENRVELEAAPLVYEILVPSFALMNLRGRLEQEVELFVHHDIEGLQAGNATPRLVGFLSQLEREFFEQFIRVPGVGVKTALKALVIPVTRAARAIEAGDATALSEMPGIGKRTADKIVAELKGKVQKYALLGAEPEPEAAPLADFQEEAMEVLARLGYKRFEAERMIRKVMAQKKSIASAEVLVQEIFKSQAPAAAER